MADAPKKTYLPARRRKPNMFLAPGLLRSGKQRIPIGRRGEPIEDVTDKIREKKTLMQKYKKKSEPTMTRHELGQARIDHEIAAGRAALEKAPRDRTWYEGEAIRTFSRYGEPAEKEIRISQGKSRSARFRGWK